MNYQNMQKEELINELHRLQKDGHAEDGEKYRKLVENSHDIIYTLSPEGILLFVSPAWTRILGHLVTDVEGHSFTEFVHPDDLTKCFEVLQKGLETGKRTDTLEYRVRHSNGTWRWHVSNGSPGFDASGNIICIDGIAHDITEQKLAWEAFRTQTQLQRLLMDISMKYISSSPEETSAEINNSLAKMGAFVEADRAYVFDYDFKKQICINTYEWCEEGIIPQIDQLQDVPLSEIPDWVAAHIKGEAIYIPDVSELPDNPLKEILESQDIKGLLTVPLMDGTSCIGFIGFDSVRKTRHFSEDEQRLLNVFAAMLVNVSQRKRAEEALKEREANYRNFFESMQDMVVIGSIDGRVLFANDAIKKNLGYTVEELDSIGILGMHPENRRKEAEEILTAMFRGEQDHCPLPIQRKDGSLIPVETRVSFGKWNDQDCIFGIIKDLSAEKEAQQRFERLFRHNPALMALSRQTDRCFIDVNDSFLKTLGYERSEVIGKSAVDLGLFVNAEIQKEMAGILADSGSISDVEMLVRHKSGKVLTGLFSGEVVYDQDKTYLLTVMVDITERILAENNLVALNKELKIAKEKAEESDRLKTAFLQNMSHEIRTPLNAISGFSGLLSDPELAQEKRESFVQIIQNSSEQLISIVTDILTISALETKQEKPEISEVSINTIIFELLAIFKQQTKNRNFSIYAKQPLTDKQSEIYTDRTKVTQILTNLLSNAVKFTHEGSIEFGYSLEDKFLKFYVKDTGIGIKPEHHQAIFERFRKAHSSTDKLYRGTGLGLSISKGFTEILGGKIWIESEVNIGSTFYFTIPYIPVDNSNSVAAQSQNITKNRHTIIVAEDEEINFAFIEELLKKFDLNIIHAKDGLETVEAFYKNPEIDLILMDIKMPNMTGYEAAKVIKEKKPDLLIVAQSAYALEHERAKYEGIFDDYLVKPINGNVLRQKVLEYIKAEFKA